MQLGARLRLFMFYHFIYPVNPGRSVNYCYERTKAAPFHWLHTSGVLWSNYIVPLSVPPTFFVNQQKWKEIGGLVTPSSKTIKYNLLHFLKFKATSHSLLVVNLMFERCFSGCAGTTC